MPRRKRRGQEPGYATRGVPWRRRVTRFRPARWSFRASTAQPLPQTLARLWRVLDACVRPSVRPIAWAVAHPFAFLLLTAGTVVWALSYAAFASEMSAESLTCGHYASDERQRSVVVCDTPERGHVFGEMGAAPVVSGG